MRDGIAPPDAATWASRLKVAAGIVFGLGLLAWFLARLHWRELATVLSEVSLAWITVAVVMMLVHYVVHAWRWGILVRHVDDQVPFKLLWSATAVGWGFNTLLPLRAGNFLRPAVVAMKRPVPYTTLLFTTVAEYVCDAVGIIFMLLWMIWLLPADMTDEGIFADVKLWGTWVGVASLVVLGIIVLLSSRQARDLVETALRPLPSDRVRQRLLVQFDHLVAGMAAVGNPLRLLEATAVTLLYWLTWLFAMLATFKAFHIELPLAGALFLEAALTLAMMVPQAPGFLGVFHVVTEQALALWGTPAAQAEGIALVFWSIVFVPITIIGVVEGWRNGLDVFGGSAAALAEIAPVTDDDEEAVRAADLE